MKLDVVFSPHDLAAGDVAGRPVFVIDILRAMTTICAAIHNGARAIIPAPSAEEAIKLSQTLGREDTVLAGEQNCLPIPGFALGNSPGEMTREAVGGKTVVMRTTNGTRALLATQGASDVHPIVAANMTVTASRARELFETHDSMLVLCGGRENGFSIDDAYCAGRLLEALLDGRRPPGL
ncbi:MAG: 2-phosphosulfolactate phosphatase, partial [Gemmatimonadales bacterium]